LRRILADDGNDDEDVDVDDDDDENVAELVSGGCS
jgi:hypothetical protein